jgi:hypothetical protein
MIQQSVKYAIPLNLKKIKNDCPLHAVFKLPDIPGPVVLQKNLLNGVSYAPNIFSIQLIEVFTEMVGQKYDVIHSLE